MATGNTYDVTAPGEEAQVLSRVVLHNGNFRLADNAGQRLAALEMSSTKPDSRS